MRREPVRLSRANQDAVYRRLSADGVRNTQAAISRDMQQSFQGWMETKGAEASGSNRVAHMRALVALSQYPLRRTAFRPTGVHDVARNEFLCQRSVSKLTRHGSFHPVEWDPSRTGPHLHRNGKRRLAPLPNVPTPMSTRKTEGNNEHDLTPRRASASLSHADMSNVECKTPGDAQRSLGARSASPTFSPPQEPSLADVQKVSGSGDVVQHSPNAVGTPTAWRTIR